MPVSALSLSQVLWLLLELQLMKAGAAESQYIQ